MDCGTTVSKCILLFLSVVFLVAGGVFAYVGAFMIERYGTFENFLQDKTATIPAAIVIGFSVVLFIFGLMGCCSTLWESKCGLSCFFVVIMLIFAAEVTALVFGFMYRSKINGMLEKPLNETISNYDGKNTESKAVDKLQKELKCCGVHNVSDWLMTTWFKTNGTVPLSCCKNTTTRCPHGISQPEQFYQEGCEVKLEQLLKDVVKYGMYVVFGFAIIKFFGMLSVCVITCKSNGRRSGYQPLYA
ncbi:tetraspanin 36 [Pholidichthys leucotaenia]